MKDDDAMVRALAPFLDDVRADLARRIERRQPALDLQDAVERAHALDADAVPHACVLASRDPSLLPDPPQPALDSPQLASFLDDVRGQIESHARRRELAPAPNPPRRMRWPLVATLVGVAAAAVLIPAVSAIRGQAVLADEDATSPAAEMDRASATSQSESTSRRPSAKRSPAPVLPTLDVPAPATDETAAIAIPEPPSSVSTRAPSHARPAPPKGPTLAELDARAQALLKSGDLGGARNALEELVRRGGTTSYAELAFGDLFTLAHRQHRTTEQTTLWRRYLARFPHGRYADDASAGLCRRDDDVECWSTYLREWPRGSHRAEARRRLEP